jgi:hypothetical protein
MRQLGYRDDRDLGGLLDEAFADGLARQLFREIDTFDYRGTWQPPHRPAPAAGSWGTDPWAETESNGHRPTPIGTGERASLQFVDHLIAIAERIPLAQRRRYYRERQSPQPRPNAPSWDVLREAIGDCLDDMNNSGYFDRAFGSTCIEVDSDPINDGNARLHALMSGDPAMDQQLTLWPPTTPTVSTWDRETTLSLIEALFDLVARPRKRDWHDYAEEWDYSDHSRSAGQLVYLWRINTVLADARFDLRLAENGADRGLLVAGQDDDRHTLVTRVLDADNDNGTKERIEHAVATFRNRVGASRADKRAAILSLHHLIERNRDQLRTHLIKRDEGALFQIANEFDLRHHREDQYTEYGDEFLDWIFWWYLATVDLLQRLHERSTDRAATSESPSSSRSPLI